ncbi:MAG: hypothetical protein RIR22_1408 [Planctomycetota bacterium]|jgi:hypothetical protein
MKATFNCSYCDNVWSIINNLKNEPESTEEINAPKAYIEDPVGYCETLGIMPNKQIRRIIAKFNRKMALLNLISACKRNPLETALVYSKHSGEWEPWSIENIRNSFKDKLRRKVLKISSNNHGQPFEKDGDYCGRHASSKISQTTRYAYPINKTAAIVF